MSRSAAVDESALLTATALSSPWVPRFHVPIVRGGEALEVSPRVEDLLIRSVDLPCSGAAR